MSDDRQKKIDAFRRAQPIEELRRKQAKAYTQSYWTVEDIDLANREAEELYRAINGLDDPLPGDHP